GLVAAGRGGARRVRGHHRQGERRGDPGCAPTAVRPGGRLRRARVGGVGGRPAEDGRRRPGPGQGDDRLHGDRARAEGPAVGAARTGRRRGRADPGAGRRGQRRPRAGPRRLMLQAEDRVAVSVPASSANLGPGFDAVGLGLGLRDEYAVHVTSTPGLVVALAGEGVDELATDETHLVAQALRTALDVCGVGWTEELAERGLGLHLECRNAIPMSAGLGSSAAALVGGLALGFALVRGGQLTDDDLTLVNTHAEVAEGHPDNSSASVYGGMTVSWMPSPKTVRTARLSVHAGIEPLVLLPASTRLSTSTARGVLSAVVPRADAVQQAARAALLTHAMTGDPTFLLDATQDRLHQEQRRVVYP